jgi:glycosyltransferase involved in cell wall biosynthesis
MIVKNEEKVLNRCLQSVRDLMDEIIIVDTGSTDRTKEIAAAYTEKIYDFAWIDDFAAARNFAFSKARGDYIYSADADELITEENYEKFKELKETLLPEIEIVQMYYGNQLSHGTIYNFDRELRPKLFKRQRDFIWEGAIHEMVRLSPVIYDSEIEITHLPEKSHADRDLAVFRSMTERGTVLSARLINIYAKELYISGSTEDFLQAEPFFTEVADGEVLSMEQLKEAVSVIVKAARLRGDALKMFRYAMKDIASEGVSEVCCELGEYYYEEGIYEEAVMWFYNAYHETQSILNLHCSGDIPLYGITKCYEKLGNAQMAEEYRKMAKDWVQELTENCAES